MMEDADQKSMDEVARAQTAVLIAAADWRDARDRCIIVMTNVQHTKDDLDRFDAACVKLAAAVTAWRASGK